MPGSNERIRNNVRAGIFVTVAILLALGVVLVLTEAWSSLRPMRRHIVTFDVKSGISNLSPGSKVRVGGVTMGRVTSVQPQTTQDPLREIHVGIELDPKVTIYDNALIVLSAPLLGTEAWLDSPSVGDPAGGKPLAEGGVIAAAASPGLLSVLLGPSNAPSSGNIIRNVEDFSAFLATIDDEYSNRVAPAFDDARSLINRVQREDWPRWAAAVDRIMTSVNSAADRLDSVVGQGQEILAESREPISRIVGNLDDASADVNAITERVRDETIDQVAALLNRGQEGIDAFANAMQTANAELEAAVPQIQDSLANATLASQQLKLATVEVRRSPWKLLYRPSTDELDHELLYEAARSFALAVADLKAASASMDRVVAMMPQHADDDAATLKRLQQSLLDSFASYQKAQQQLIDVLLIDQP
jgi:ABC-type transporter Mla subunit MlaD